MMVLVDVRGYAGAAQRAEGCDYRWGYDCDCKVWIVATTAAIAMHMY